MLIKPEKLEDKIYQLYSCKSYPNAGKGDRIVKIKYRDNYLHFKKHIHLFSDIIQKLSENSYFIPDIEKFIKLIQ